MRQFVDGIIHIQDMAVGFLGLMSELRDFTKLLTTLIWV